MDIKVRDDTGFVGFVLLSICLRGLIYLHSLLDYAITTKLLSMDLFRPLVIT